MSENNYFNIREVLIPLIVYSDRKTLETLYLTYKELMEDPIVIHQLQKIHNLPGKLNTFADFIFETLISH